MKKDKCRRPLPCLEKVDTISRLTAIAKIKVRGHARAQRSTALLPPRDGYAAVRHCRRVVISGVELGT